MTAPTVSRQLALEILEEVERGEAWASATLDRALDRQAGLSTADRGLVTQLVYGVLRHQTRLDVALEHFATRGLAKAHPRLRRILRLAALQLVMLDRIPAPAAIDQAVSLAREQLDAPRAGFANALLRRLATEGPPALPDAKTDPKGFLRDACSLPPWIAREFRARFGDEEATRLGAALVEQAPLTLRANRLQLDRDALAESLTAAHPEARLTPTPLAPDGLRAERLPDPARTTAHEDGAFALQDEGSQLVGELLAPRPGERLLDACAGRGGKTLQLASLTNNQATIVAAELRDSALQTLLARAERAGVSGVTTVEGDLTRPGEALTGGPPFHRILLDAPCSGLGVLRRHPEAKWRLSPRDVKELAATQAALLDSVSALVAPGGLLVYAVCTITRAEGPEQVTGFLARHPDFSAEPPPASERVDWSAVTAPGRKLPAIQTLPHRHGADGFYAIRLRRGS